MKAKKGTVYLVGAGPGDPGLLTIKGKDCLTQADVVVYDSLANPQLLEYAPDAAERVYVGKQGGNHAMKQDDINALLVKKASDGNVVVRLKGGDPYIFGRGAEEALVLLDAGVRFEEVPGITSGVAAPAYAGIPPTYRALNSVLTFVTGHENPDKNESAIDWSALASSGTLVFYMGMKNLPTIASRLIAAGKPLSTPAAVIHRGTLPAQRVVTGSLENIVEKVKAADLKPPSIILVGEVAELRSKLCWFEQGPLFGKRILVTRSRTQASGLVSDLRELGADVIPFPTIRIEPTEKKQPLRDAVNQLDTFDWVIFTSVNAVDYLFETIAEQGRDSRTLAGCKVCATGSATTERLMAHGIKPDLIPERYTSTGVLSALNSVKSISGNHFLLPRADIAPQELPDALTEAGAKVTQVEAYKTLQAKPDAVAIEFLKTGKADIITFTSSSTAKNFAALVKAELKELPSDIYYVSIGPETTKAAVNEGMQIEIEAEQHNIEGLVEAITKRFGKRS